MNFKGDQAVILCPKCGAGQYPTAILSAEDKLDVHLTFDHGSHMAIHPLVSHGSCSICHKRDMVECLTCDSKLLFHEGDGSIERIPIPHKINQLFTLSNGELRCLRHVLEPEKKVIKDNAKW